MIASTPAPPSNHVEVIETSTTPPCNDKCRPVTQCVKSLPAPLSLVTVCSGVMVSIHVALSTQSHMGMGVGMTKEGSLDISNFKGMQFAIIIFACLTFILSATALTLVKPDSRIGAILVQRIMKTQKK